MADGGQKVYMTTSLQPDVVDRIVVDDSPVTLYDEFWPFLGVDIPIANILKHDEKIIRLMARRQILNMLMRTHEGNWDKISIVEYENRPKTDKKGQIIMIGKTPVMERVVKSQYRLVELFNSIDSKVYMKLCRGRMGFTLNALTEERSHIRQDVRDNRPMMAGMPDNQTTTENSGWGL